MIPESIIIRYLKVSALKDRGSPGERNNAANICTRMEREYPGLLKAANRYQLSGEQTGDTQKGRTRKTPFGDINISEAFDFFRAAAGAATEFADHVSQAHKGVQLAQHVTSSLRGTKAGNVLLTLKMSITTYRQAKQLNQLQSIAFRKALHERLDMELDALLQD